MRSLISRVTIVAALAASLAACSPKSTAVTAEDMVLGDPNAKVTVIEYASVACPHCATWNAEVFPAFKAKYIDTGKVRWTYHEFLTPPEAVAAAGVLVARCAGKDKYFSVIDALFHSQEEMYRTGDARGTLLKVAQSAGMTEAQFNACVQDEAAAKALNDRVQAAQKDRNITSTPTFYVNGKKLKEGELSMQELEAAVAGAGK